MKTTQSGYPGVRYSSIKNMWEARIPTPTKVVFLGQFHELEDAIACRKAAEARHGLTPQEEIAS